MENDRLIRIEDKIDRIVDRISQIDVTLGMQHICLDEHIRRTALLEDRVKPIEDHVAMVTAVGKLLASIGLAIGLMAGISEILTYLRH